MGLGLGSGTVHVGIGLGSVTCGVRFRVRYLLG